MAASPEPFVMAVPEALLNDLQQRLALTRWPDEIPGSGALRRESYVCQRTRTLLATPVRLACPGASPNNIPQYRVQLEDITLHYIHQPGVGPAPCPCS